MFEAHMETQSGNGITMTRQNTDKRNEEDINKQTINENDIRTKGSKSTAGEQKEREERDIERKNEHFRKELTAEVEVEGAEIVSMMDILKQIKIDCGVVVGCRVKGKHIFEITMRDEKAKEKLMDGIRVNGASVHAREIMNNEMVVSFIGLPVYISDEHILQKLVDWGVTAVSAIRRRMWPGTDIADGTRFLKVRFNKEVSSLPYSTKFETLRGAEYFRVIHDRQARVCRLCIKPGHIFRECPEFRCFTCGKNGHYARECDARRTAGEDAEQRAQQQDEGEATAKEDEDGHSDMEEEEEKDVRDGAGGREDGGADGAGGSADGGADGAGGSADGGADGAGGSADGGADGAGGSADGGADGEDASGDRAAAPNNGSGCRETAGVPGRGKDRDGGDTTSPMEDSSSEAEMAQREKPEIPVPEPRREGRNKEEGPTLGTRASDKLSAKRKAEKERDREKRRGNVAQMSLDRHLLTR